jgi:hypothetical protein
MRAWSSGLSEKRSGISTWCVGLLNQKNPAHFLQPNHLLSAPPVFLKLTFNNTADLYSVRREILPLAEANSASLDAVDAYAEVVSAEAAASGFDEGDEHDTKAWGDEGGNDPKKKDREPADCVIDVREYDINYYLRVAIDLSEQLHIIPTRLTMPRCPSRALVLGAISHRANIIGTDSFHREACGTRRHGVRYRDFQATP